MKAGMTLVGRDGKQVLLYPLPQLNVTQATWGSASLSHCCGYPIDVVGTTAKATMYAPCDCHVTWEGTYDNGHPVIFTSDQEVHTPGGIRKVSFLFGHGDLLGNKSTFKQGQPIYTTGSYGLGTGDHCHIETSSKANAAYISSGITCGYGNLCWMLDGSVNPTQMFYINGTQIVSTLGLSFKTYDGGHEGGGDIIDWIIPVHPSDPYNRSIALTEEEVQNNARCFYGYMNITHGFTLNAVCGMLGNIESESGINPNMWQGLYSGANPPDLEGFGFVQWTPYVKITDWLKDKGYWGNFQTYGNAECDKIQEERLNGRQWIETETYPLSFEDFATSNQSAGYLAGAFLYNYERPSVPDVSTRAAQAEKWYAFLKDWTPVLPGETEPGKKKKKAFWMYLKPAWKRF